MSGRSVNRRRLVDRPWVMGMATATATSAVGVAINIATTLVANPIAWTAVAVATAATGGIAARLSNNHASTPSVVIEEDVRHESLKVLRSEKRRTSRRISRGVVKRRIIETRPDGTRLETIEFFSEELAREDFE